MREIEIDGEREGIGGGRVERAEGCRERERENERDLDRLYLE